MVRFTGNLLIFLFTLISLTGTAPLAAQEANGLLNKLRARMADTQQRNAASLAGRDRALICSYCHGEDGNSLKPEVPNLAGQNPIYLLDQIGRFARGERKDFVMNSLASKFTEEDRINLAIYYADKKVQPTEVDRALAVRGKAIYLNICQRCHGHKGLGNIGFARLAGQKQGYIKKTLNNFRQNATIGPNGSRRRSKIMEPIAGRLSEQDIQALAAYVASLR